MRNLIRTLLTTACKVFGFGFGIFALFFLFSWSSPKQIPQITSSTHPVIEPNHLNQRKTYNASSPTILKIDIQGMIGDESLNKNTFRQQLTEAMEQLNPKKVKGLLLVINSTGGTVHDSEAIYQQLLLFKKQYQIPIFAYSDGFLASGAYYIAAAADVILVSPQSWTGSIGVVMPTFFNIHKVLESWKVGTLNISSGEGKDILNPTRPWKENESESISALVDFLYDEFVNVVATSREKLSTEVIKNKLGANIFHSKDALDLGLIDQIILSEQHALRLISQSLDINENYQVVAFPMKTFFGQLFSFLPLNEMSLRTNFLESYLPERYKNNYRGQFLYLHE